MKPEEILIYHRYQMGGSIWMVMRMHGPDYIDILPGPHIDWAYVDIETTVFGSEFGSEPFSTTMRLTVPLTQFAQHATPV